jgi:hypothetical protein
MVSSIQVRRELVMFKEPLKAFRWLVMTLKMARQLYAIRQGVTRKGN